MDESIERYVNAVNITNGPYDVTFEFSISSPAGIVRPGTVPTMVKKDVVVIRTSHMLAKALLALLAQTVDTADSVFGKIYTDPETDKRIDAFIENHKNKLPNA